MSFARFFAGDRHTGRVLRFGESVSVDQIHPAEYFSLNRERVEAGLFAGIDPALADAVRPGDIVVAGKNFGCGSSREVYAQAMAWKGIAAVVALSVARIFFRNMVNYGILVLDGQDAAVRALTNGDEAIIDLHAGTIHTPQSVVPIENPPGEEVLRMLRENSARIERVGCGTTST